MDYSQLSPDDIIAVPLSKIILEQYSALSGGFVLGIIVGFLMGASLTVVFFELPQLINWLIKKIRP